MLALGDIRIRDPFVLAVPEERCYYLYGTTDENVWEGPGVGFDCYRSSDLVAWEGPMPAFRAGAGFWGTTQFWAPEVHFWRGRYFMFATFAAGDVRGTQVLVAEHPAGPFVEFSDGPVTPTAWLCLDGTLHIDGDGEPWIVFCHEWLQAGDGGMYAQRLSADLRRALGAPVLLFRGGDAPWTAPLDSGSQFITDGPWLRLVGGQLLMLWSSHSANGYAMGMARSESGSVVGPWTHDAVPLWDEDGGHGMIVDTLDGRTLLTLHRPNTSPLERAEFHALLERGGSIVLAD